MVSTMSDMTRSLKHKLWVDGFIEEMEERNVPPEEIIMNARKFFDDDEDLEEEVLERLTLLKECTACGQNMLWNSDEERYYCPVC